MQSFRDLLCIGLTNCPFYTLTHSGITVGTAVPRRWLQPSAWLLSKARKQLYELETPISAPRYRRSETHPIVLRGRNVGFGPSPVTALPPLSDWPSKFFTVPVRLRPGPSVAQGVSEVHSCLTSLSVTLRLRVPFGGWSFHSYRK